MTTTTNGTNGHPFPDRPSADVQARAEPTRELVVAVWDGEVLLELAELGNDELIAECARRGLHAEEMIPAKELGIDGEPGRVIPELKEAIERARNGKTVSLGSFAKFADDEPRDTERPPATEVESAEEKFLRWEKAIGWQRHYDGPGARDVWLLNVPKDMLASVQDVATQAALEVYGNDPLPFLIHVATPEKTRELLGALGQAGNPERDPRLVYREVAGLLPSERATQFARARLGRRDDDDPFGGTHSVTPNMHDVLKMLDERLGSS
jgi:hypothetical protein